MNDIYHSTLSFQTNNKDNGIKNILNLTDYDFTDRQIRAVYNHDYKLSYPVTAVEYNWNKEKNWGEMLSFYIRTVQDRINKMVGHPDCVIIDIPEAIVPQFNEMFKESNIKFLNVRHTLVKLTNGTQLDVRLLSQEEK